MLGTLFGLIAIIYLAVLNFDPESRMHVGGQARK
jgi:hypothetical protein